jgi:hypothetical protein
MTTKWYVTMVQPSARANQAAGVFPLVGPFDSQEEAARLVSSAALEASMIDGANAHNGFGVASFERETHPPGPLNKRFARAT